jgi:multidrug efflux pump subunit AcrA (membrane-fusion protein)/ribosomal protein S27E
MKLTPIAKNAAGTNSAASEIIAIDAATIQTMGIRTTHVARGPLRRTIRTVGVVAYNETTLGDVTTKFKGWIEKLYVNSTGELVMRGDPLFEIYSPELYSAQVEYLMATGSASNNIPGSGEIRESARTKLKFFDISDEQIAKLDKERQPQKTMRIVAPQDGFVAEKDVVEGQMVDAGMKTYRLADLGLVWVQADIYEQDLPYVKLGQEATVTLAYMPDREFRGRVTYIYPNVDEKTRTARVRMEFHNPGYYLKPGMFATAKVVSELAPSVLLIPDMAILRSGEKTTVFVALRNGKFEARTVTLGPQAENDEYEVVSGLSEGEEIVTSGQFMLDSESQLREAIQKMNGPGRELDAAPRATNAAATKGESRSVKYICPMPEHVSIEYDHPGKCPICGMTLVPVTQETLKKLQPGGKLLYYTCPMPEHSDVHSDKPGKCPKCGMTLIPVMETLPNESTANVKLPSPLYTCEMHLDVVSDKPGKCFKCGMTLVDAATLPETERRTAEKNWQLQHQH